MTVPRPFSDDLDVIVVRTPVFSVSLLERYLSASDRAAELRAIFAEPLARDALALASYGVHAALQRADRSRALDRALVRYLMRMAMRPTPFGLFASAGVATAGERTLLRLAGPDELDIQARLSVDVVADRLDEIRTNTDLQDRRWRANPTAYRSGERIHYVETRTQGGQRTHHLVAAREDGVLGQALDAARGWSALEDLARLVTQVAEVSLEQAQAYVEELAAAQLLVDELQIAIAGPAPDEQVVAAVPERSAVLQCATAALRSSQPWDVRLEQVAAALGTEPSSSTVAVDAVGPADQLTLGPDVLAELQRGVAVVAGLTERQLSPAMERFRDAFVKRWGERWIPLTTALDSEMGIGFDDAPDSSALLDDVTGPSGGPGLPFTRRDAAMVRLLTSALRDGLTEIDLGQDRWAQLLPADPAPLPEAYALCCRIAAASAEAMDAGDLAVHVRNVNGPSGARMLARFAQGDATLAARLREHHLRESARHPDALLAEVVHLPEGRVGNILSRPTSREYELVLLSGSTLEQERQIFARELLLGVVGGELQLRRAVDRRRVLPRMASAHAYFRGNIGLYRFLCLMQHADGGQAMSFMWGAASGSPFLPRVRVGRIILSLSTWNLGPEDVAGLDLDRALETVSTLRERRRLPQLVAVVTGEMELTLDLSDPLCCEVFVEMLREGHTEVVEQWPPLDQLPVEGPDGRHVSDLVLAYSARGAVEPERTPPMVLGPVERHLPGGEWLYLKVYCGTVAADDILEALSPTLTGRDWFFIRYADPDHHLRIRVRHGLDLLGPLHEVLANRADVVNVQLDTYEPEVERYGGPEAIAIAERVFAVDSHFGVEVLARLSDGDVGADERWRITLASLDALWQDSGLSREEQDAAIAATQGNYAREFGLVGDRTKPIGARMRADRERLQRVMARDPEDDLAPGYELIEQRSQHLRPLFQELRELESQGRLSSDLASIVQSIAHMNVNRWLRNQQRPQEAVLYALLVRLRRGQAARS